MRFLLTALLTVSLLAAGGCQSMSTAAVKEQQETLQNYTDFARDNGIKFFVFGRLSPQVGIFHETTVGAKGDLYALFEFDPDQTD